MDGVTVVTGSEVGRIEVLGIDADGVLWTERWPEIGTPHQAMMEALVEASRKGYRLVLWTCREGERLAEALQMCERFGLRFDGINANLAERVERYGSDPRKIGVDRLYDDRAFGWDWYAALSEIRDLPTLTTPAAGMG